MKGLLHKFDKFYSGVIVNIIGIFIFVGILSVVFGDYGWIPNKNIYAISQFVCQMVIPAAAAVLSAAVTMPILKIQSHKVINGENDSDHRTQLKKRGRKK